MASRQLVLPSTATIKALVDLHLFVEPHATGEGSADGDQYGEPAKSALHQHAWKRLSPEAALPNLRRIQPHTVSIASTAPIHGVSTVQPRQADALAALRIKKPTLDTQLSLL